MGKLIKISAKKCNECRYKSPVTGMEQKECCDYIGYSGHSRYFEKGEKQYDGSKYCNKFEAATGKRKKKKITFTKKGLKLNEERMEQSKE